MLRQTIPNQFRYVLLASCVCVSAAADWLQFRGNDTSGAAPETETGLPTTWDLSPDAGENGVGTNVAWRADLPGRGVSSPIVVAGKVIVTASSGFKRDRLHVLAFDAGSGKLAWQRQLWATGRTLCHPTMAVAAPTPASDGERIFAFYSSNDLVCLDLQGKVLWYRGLGYDYPTAANDVGMASSPVVVDDTLIVQVENKGESFAAGLDATTGETRWRQQRQQAMNWASPAVLRGKTFQEPIVLLQSPSRLTAHRPRTGEELWSYSAGCSVIPSVTADEGTVYLPANGLMALRPGSKPGSAAEPIWSEAKLGVGSSSPVVHGGRIYTINGAPALTCADAATARILWRLRLTGKFWATPLVAGGHIYCVNDAGLVQVVRLGEQGELVGECDFREPILASPAASNGALYVRSDKHLWKIAAG